MHHKASRRRGCAFPPEPGAVPPPTPHHCFSLSLPSLSWSSLGVLVMLSPCACLVANAVVAHAVAVVTLEPAAASCAAQLVGPLVAPTSLQSVGAPPASGVAVPDTPSGSQSARCLLAFGDNATIVFVNDDHHLVVVVGAAGGPFVFKVGECCRLWERRRAVSLLGFTFALRLATPFDRAVQLFNHVNSLD